MKFLKYCFGLNIDTDECQDKSLFVKMETIDPTQLYWVKENDLFKSIGFILIKNDDKESGKFVDLNEKGSPIFKQVKYADVYYKKSHQPMERN